MAKQFASDLSPGTHMVVLCGDLHSVIDRLAYVISPKADVPVEIIDDLMVAYTYAKQAQESLRLARVTFAELVHGYK